MKIQWNKVTWYSKLIALALFVALPFIGFYYGARYGETIAPIGQAPVSATNSAADQTAGSSLPAYYNDPAEWQTDANSDVFSIAYPIDFDAQDNYSAAPSADWRVNADNVPGIRYFTLTVPQAFEPQTNFADATLTVGASQNSSAVADCLVPDQSGGEATTTSTAAINGVPFTIFRSNSAGAGNYYQTTSYRTVHEGACYAIEYTVHSSQIANYPPSYDLRPFDEATIDSLMQNIVGTFKFL